MEQRDKGEFGRSSHSEEGNTTKLTKSRKIRIAYLSGPCDAPAVYREWREGAQQNYFGTDFMKQFLQVAENLDAESYGKHRCGRFIFENHPNPRWSERRHVPSGVLALVSRALSRR